MVNWHLAYYQESCVDLLKKYFEILECMAMCDYFMKGNLLMSLKLTVPTDGMRTGNRGTNYFV
jgi:hypothetical protein